MIPITLTKPEAKVCRDAAKAEKQTLFVIAGTVELDRGQWHDISRWLTWYSCDFERDLKLDTRHAAERLSKRIEEVIEHWDREHPRPVLRESETVVQGCLF